MKPGTAPKVPEELRPVGETEFVKDVAEKYARLNTGTEIAAGMAAHANLKLGDSVKRVLEAHLEVGGKRVKSIRYGCLWDPDPKIKSLSPQGIMLDRKWREGYSCLKEYGLSFDAWLYFTQLPELLDLARSFPDTPIITGHMGGLIGVASYAGRREEIFLRWKKSIAELASCPNVYVKLGGQGNVRCGWGFNQLEKPAGSAKLAQGLGPLFQLVYREFRPRTLHV